MSMVYTVTGDAFTLIENKVNKTKNFLQNSLVFLGAITAIGGMYTVNLPTASRVEKLKRADGFFSYHSGNEITNIFNLNQSSNNKSHEYDNSESDYSVRLLFSSPKEENVSWEAMSLMPNNEGVIMTKHSTINASVVFAGSLPKTPENFSYINNERENVELTKKRSIVATVKYGGNLPLGIER